MNIETVCDECNKTVRAPEKFAGRRVKCPGCGAAVDIPLASAEDEEFPRKSTPSSPGKSLRRFRDADDSPEMPFPSRKKTSKNKKSSKSKTASEGLSVGIIAAIVGIPMTALLLGGVVVWWVIGKGTKPSNPRPQVAAQQQDAPAKPEPIPAPANPAPQQNAVNAVKNEVGAEEPLRAPQDKQPDLVMARNSLAEPPAGELEALEDFNPDRDVEEKNHEPMQLWFQGKGDKPETRSFPAADVARYGVDQLVVETFTTVSTPKNSIGLDGRVKERFTASASGGIVSSNRKVSTGINRFTAFTRNHPRHVGRLLARDTSKASAEAIRDLQRNTAARQAVRQQEEFDRALNRESSTRRDPGFARTDADLGKERKDIQSRLAELSPSGGKYGSAEGVWTLSHENGQLRALGRYRGGRRAGRFLCFNEQGRPVWEGFYEQGRLNSSRAIDPNESLYGEIAEFFGQSGRLSSLDFSSNGKRLAVAFSDTGDETTGIGFASEVRVWEMETWELVAKVRPSAARIQAILAPDGESLVIASDQTTELWNVARQEKLAEFRTLWSPQGLMIDEKWRGHVSFSPDGRLLAVRAPSWTTDDGKPFYAGVVLLYEAHTGKLNEVIYGREPDNENASSDFQTVAFSENGAVLMIGQSGNRTTIWDTKSNEIVARVVPNADTSKPLLGKTRLSSAQVAAELAGRLLTAGSLLGAERERFIKPGWLGNSPLFLLGKETLVAYELPSGDVLYEQSNLSEPVFFSPDSTAWAMKERSERDQGQKSNRYVVCSGHTGDRIGSFAFEANAHHARKILSPNGRLAAVMMSDGHGARGMQRSQVQIEVFDTRLDKRFTAKCPEVNLFDFSPDGKYLAIAGIEGSVLIHDLSALTPATRPGNQPPTIALKSNHGQEVMVGDHIAVSFAAEDPEKQATFIEYRTDESAPWEFDRDGTVVVLARSEGTMSLEARALDSELAASETLRLTITVVPDPWKSWHVEDRIEFEDTPVKISLPNGTPRIQFATEPDYGRVIFSPDGAILAGAGPYVRIWNASGKGGSKPTMFNDRATRALAFSPDGKTLCVGDERGKLSFWKYPGKSAKTTDEQHLGSVHCLDYSADGTMVVSGGGSNEKTIKVWNAANGKLINSFKTKGDVRNVAFNPEANQIVYSTSQAALIISATDGETIATCSKLSYPTSVRFTRDGSQVVVFDPHGKAVCLHSAIDGSLARKMEFSVKVNGTSMDLSADESIIAVGRDDGAIVLMNFSDGKILATLRGHSGAVSSVSFSSDASQLALASVAQDRAIFLWKH